ncbi:MAG: stage III sporulation protein AB [[Clostridium] leptum]
MIKMMGCLMIVLTGAAVGYLQSKRLTARTLFFEEYQKFLSELTLQIRYDSSSLERILEKFSDYRRLAPVLRICREKIQEGNSFFESWLQGVGKLSKDNGLLKGDIELLLDLRKRPWELDDLEGQLSHLKLNSELTKLRLEEARECKVKKGKLYQMLGLSLGITTALLFL